MTASNITSDQNQYSLQVKFLQADPFTIAKGDMSVYRLLGFLRAYILLQFLTNSPFTVIRFIVYLLFCLLSLALSNVFLILVCLFSCSLFLSFSSLLWFRFTFVLLLTLSYFQVFTLWAFPDALTFARKSCICICSFGLLFASFWRTAYSLVSMFHS